MNDKRGFTLLELVVSIAAIALMSMVLSQVFFSTLRTNKKTELFKDVKQNGDIAQEMMVRMIREAQAVTSPCTSSGVSSQSIDLITEDGGTTTLGCLVDGAITRVASESAYTEYITSKDVTLGGATCATSSLEFRCFGGAGSQSTVIISFSLAQKGTAVDQFEQSSGSFQTSVTTRNVPL